MLQYSQRIHNAATGYLRTNTYNDLYALYKPKIQASTEKKIIGSVSTKDSWVALTGKWNSLANSVAGRIANKNGKPRSLIFFPKKLFNGFFLKVELGGTEDQKRCFCQNIPDSQGVFGSLDNKTKKPFD